MSSCFPLLVKLEFHLVLSLLAPRQENVCTESSENEYHTTPLPRSQSVVEVGHGRQESEELAGSRGHGKDERAGEVDSAKDKELSDGTQY